MRRSLRRSARWRMRRGGAWRPRSRSRAALLAQLAAIRQLLRDVEALDRLEQEFGESAAKYEGLPRSLVPGWEGWRAATEAFPEAARPPLEDAAFEEFRQARPDLVDEIRKAVETVRDRLVLAAPEADLDTAMSGAGYREKESAWQPHAADFPILCEGNIVVGDLVHFTAPAEALPGSAGDGEEREVSVVARLVDRKAGRTEPDDLCTLETRWRSDGGPGGPFTVRLDMLTVGGCTRTKWHSEEARSVVAEAQTRKLEEKRQELYEQAVRRERHLSKTMKM